MIDLRLGDCLDVMKDIPDGTIDSIITDPPAGIAFMGKDWDKDKGGRDNWIAWMTEVMAECLRVLKPGAHGFVWALPRTSHWTATALEDAGFEVRDIVTHIFGSGFPKNHDVSKAIDKMHGAKRDVVATIKKTPSSASPNMNEGWKRPWAENHPKTMDITAPSTEEAQKWEGWGSALKPSNEHWILVRKPLEKKLTVAKNVLKHGTGGINIDQSRIQGNKRTPGFKNPDSNGQFGSSKNENLVDWDNSQGRFPANTIVDESAMDELDRIASTTTNQSPAGNKNPTTMSHGKNVKFSNKKQTVDVSKFQLGGDPKKASRFFYCPKASKKDKGSTNSHPTVKNTKLMSYLIKMITPPNGIVLDPFMGSGSTGVAAKREVFGFIGIEMEREYFDIAYERLLSNGNNSR